MSGFFNSTSSSTFTGTIDAEDVNITDTGGYYTGTNAEDAFKEIGNFMDTNTGGIATKTSDNFQMWVDPVAGQTPPANTLVTNQAEYNALGYSLKTAQDAINILPKGIGHTVVIWMAGGTHLGWSNVGGYAGHSVFLSIRGFVDTSNTKFNGDSYPYYPGIIFMGMQEDTIDDDQSGVASATANTITRSAGTWTTNSLDGYMVKFTSGANWGLVVPITENTETAITVPPNSMDYSGACTFEVYDHGTVLLASTDGVTRATRGIDIWDNPGVDIFFDNLKFGIHDVPFVNIFADGNVWIQKCSGYMGGGGGAGGCIEAGKKAIVYWSSLYFDSTSEAGVWARDDESYIEIDKSYFRGDPAEFLVDCGDGAIQLRRMTIRPDATFGSKAIRISSLFYCTDTIVEGGDTVHTAVYIHRKADIYFFGIDIRNCGTAVWADGCYCKVNTGGFPTLGSGNGIGWRTTSANILLTDFNQVGANIELYVDGETFSYSKLINIGDEIIGTQGGSFMLVNS